MTDSPIRAKARRKQLAPVGVCGQMGRSRGVQDLAMLPEMRVGVHTGR